MINSTRLQAKRNALARRRHWTLHDRWSREKKKRKSTRDRGWEKIRSLKHPLGLRSRIKSSLDVNVCGAGRLGVFVEVIFAQNFSTQNSKRSQKMPIYSKAKFLYLLYIYIYIKKFLQIQNYFHIWQENRRTLSNKDIRTEEITSTGSRGRFAGV